MDERTPEEILADAKLLAVQYDYDKAISLLQKYSGYKENTEMQDAVKQYEEIKASCKSWPLEEVTHVFYHTLIKDTSKAFDGDYKEADYNQVMTTIDEFNKITETMYEKGYVMVSIYDMAKADADGNITEGEILLPEGKIPFVLSQDDVCYYHYMDGDGYASKLVVDENGKIRNEYIEDDGSVSVGDYDMVPLIDRFVEEHPDFSYRGAKGIVALTGYNGILGYRTDQSYETRPDDLDANKVEWLDAHPDFSLAKEREGAKKVADAMKAEGWLFASHTWGHQNVGQIGLETLQTDTRKFKDNVDPLIGGTDIIIFAFGTDLCGPEDYHGDKFEYLKGAGYNYFCNVDSSKYYVQIRERYFRQGRRNLDGYRMYYHPELLEDLPFQFFATSSIDALVHSVESSLSPKGNETTRMFGYKAIEMILKGYMEIRDHGQEARIPLMKDFLMAANYAGIAFGNAGCAAVHALSYPLGAKYHVAHGESNYAMFTGVLNNYMEIKSDGEIARLNKFMAGILGCDVDVVYEELEKLLNVMIPKKALHEYGVSEEELEEFTDSVLENQGRLMANNFVKLDRERVYKIYKECF